MLLRKNALKREMRMEVESLKKKNAMKLLKKTRERSFRAYKG